MSAPTSMSRFLAQSAEDFIAQKNRDLANRLVGVFDRARITDVCSLTIKTEEALLNEGCTPGDLAQVREHLAWYDISFAPGEIAFEPVLL